MGPMFAGKTTELLRRVQQAEVRGDQVIILNSSKDVRYGENVCASHDGVTRKAVGVDRLNDLVDPDHPLSEHVQLKSYDVIAIDEAQFFSDLRDFCVNMVEVHGKTVIAAGLSGDFRRQAFGDLVQLVPFADDVDMLTARCAFCDRDAIFTLRIVANEAQHLVGGADAYSPVCRKHYMELHSYRTPKSDGE